MEDLSIISAEIILKKSEKNGHSSNLKGRDFEGILTPSFYSNMSNLQQRKTQKVFIYFNFLGHI